MHRVGVLTVEKFFTTDDGVGIQIIHGKKQRARAVLTRNTSETPQRRGTSGRSAAAFSLFFFFFSSSENACTHTAQPPPSPQRNTRLNETTKQNTHKTRIPAYYTYTIYMCVCVYTQTWNNGKYYTVLDSWHQLIMKTLTDPTPDVARTRPDSLNGRRHIGMPRCSKREHDANRSLYFCIQICTKNYQFGFKFHTYS